MTYALEGALTYAVTVTVTHAVAGEVSCAVPRVATHAVAREVARPGTAPGTSSAFAPVLAAPASR